jgi:hypothetical protein
MGIGDEVMKEVRQQMEETINEELEKKVAELVRDGYRGPLFAWLTYEGDDVTAHMSDTMPPAEQITDGQMKRVDITDEFAAEYLAKKGKP